MGPVYAEITLKNATDVADAERGIIDKDKVRETTVRAMVDTCAGSLVMDEDVFLKLGLSVKGLRGVTLAGGGRMVARVTNPVEIHWKNRSTTFPALFLPGNHETLLGAIPLEDMDLIVCPKKQELVGAHGDEILMMI